MLYPISSDEHKLLQQGFAEWLAVLGYAGSSVAGLPRHVQEFLHHQEAHEKFKVVLVRDLALPRFEMVVVSPQCDAVVGCGLHRRLVKGLLRIEDVDDIIECVAKRRTAAVANRPGSSNQSPIYPSCICSGVCRC